MSQQTQSKKTKTVNDSGSHLKPVIRWNEDRTDLIATGEQIDLFEEYKARAKGTTVYELINACGGYDNLQTMIPQNSGTMQDFSEVPEFTASLEALAKEVAQKTVAQYQEKQKNDAAELEQLKARLAELESKNGGAE